ncbi:hypothetical protein BDR22DRAFT_891416 [Usnea florida]
MPININSEADTGSRHAHQGHFGALGGKCYGYNALQCYPNRRLGEDTSSPRYYDSISGTAFVAQPGVQVLGGIGIEIFKPLIRLFLSNDEGVTTSSLKTPVDS